MKKKAKQIDLARLQTAAGEASILLKALANRDRLLLLCHLAPGELCVSDLETVSGILQPTLSQQLGVLRSEELVATRREGKQIFYRVASAPALAIMQVLYQQFCQADA